MGMVSVSRILFIQRKAADRPGKTYTTRAIETEPYMYCHPQYPPPFPSTDLSVVPTVAIQEFSVVFKELAPYSVGEFAFCLTQKIKTIKCELPLKFFKWNLKSLHYLVWLTSPAVFLWGLTLWAPFPVLYGRESAGECRQKDSTASWSVSCTQAIRGSLRPPLCLECGFHLPFSLKDCSRDIALR